MMQHWKLNYALAMLQMFYTLYAIIFTIDRTSATEHGFYAISHQRNTIPAIDYAMGHGANGVEIDLRFDDSGKPTVFHHGHPCDCDCYLLSKHKPFICTIPHFCSKSTPADVLVKHLATFPSLALIWFDSKTSSLSVPAQVNAGKNVFDLTQKLLFKNGYKGKVLIGSPNAKKYLETIAHLAGSSPYQSRYLFCLDEIHNKPMEVMEYLATFPSRNVVYDDGLTACSPEQFYDQILAGAINKLNGVISNVFTWTVDSTESFERYYYQSGAGGMITNKIPELIAWLKEKKIPLATVDDDSLKPATSKKVIYPECSCKHENREGCIVNKASPPHSACRCKSYGVLCKGSAVLCKQPEVKECTTPGTTVQHCVQGGGDCDGYPDKCVCQYFSGGCRITTVAPPNTACYCSYRGAWTCTGHVVFCKDPKSRYCSHPDISKESCHFGGGDCGAYKLL